MEAPNLNEVDPCANSVVFSNKRLRAGKNLLGVIVGGVEQIRKGEI